MLMLAAKNLFAGMAKWPMPNVMQQCPAENCGSVGQQFWVMFCQIVKGTTRNGHHTQRMGKPRSFGSVKGKAGWP